MKMVTIECSKCGKKAEKPKKEIDRQKRNGREHFYCSLSCSATTNHLKEWQEKSFPIEYSNRVDEYTGFREYLRRANKRKHNVDIDLQYLKELWEEQGGKCFYTNVPLEHPCWNKSSGRYNYMGSLDRIDSSKGYVKGNVRFVSVSVNWLKNKMGDEHIKEFFEIVSGVTLGIDQ